MLNNLHNNILKNNHILFSITEHYKFLNQPYTEFIHKSTESHLLCDIQVTLYWNIHKSSMEPELSYRWGTGIKNRSTTLWDK